MASSKQRERDIENVPDVIKRIKKEPKSCSSSLESVILVDETKTISIDDDDDSITDDECTDSLNDSIELDYASSCNMDSEEEKEEDSKPLYKNRKLPPKRFPEESEEEYRKRASEYIARYKTPSPTENVDFTVNPIIEYSTPRPYYPWQRSQSTPIIRPLVFPAEQAAPPDRRNVRNVGCPCFQCCQCCPSQYHPSYNFNQRIITNNQAGYALPRPQVDKGRRSRKRNDPQRFLRYKMDSELMLPPALPTPTAGKNSTGANQSDSADYQQPGPSGLYIPPNDIKEANTPLDLRIRRTNELLEREEDDD